MMPSDRFDRRLPAILDEIAQPRTPDYFDDLLGLTARTRQRPAWSLPERWLPMVDIMRQPAFARQVPWRPIAVLTFILLLLAASLAFFIGSQQQRVPAPFGLARNGLVAYAKDGDIYAADPVTGTAKAVVTGPETDLQPIFSLDGTRFAFERKAQGTSGPGSLFVARADGAALTSVTPAPLADINSYAFSPDGREILVSTGPGGATTILIAKSDGSGVQPLPVGTLTAASPAYRAPDGGEIAFVGWTARFVDSGDAGTTPPSGLYAVHPDGSGLRTIVEPSNVVMADPIWSPDGRQIAYTAWAADYMTGGSLARTYVVPAAGHTVRLLRTRPATDVEGTPIWSNDGTRLLVQGCATQPSGECTSVSSVLPTDGGAAVELDVAGLPPLDSMIQSWSPDDTSILTTPLDAQGMALPGSLLSDPLTGRSRPAPWATDGGPSWQRLAR